MYLDGRGGGLVVSTLDSGASGPGSSAAWDIVLCSWARHTLLSQCNQQITKSIDVVDLYITHQHIHQSGFQSSVSEAMLPNINKLFCVHRQNHSGSVALVQ